MEIPVLSRFIEGLRLFFSSKRLRWLTLVFLIGAVSILLFRELGLIFPQIATGLLAIFGGIFPMFFLLTSFVSLLGLQRFVADEESYAKSMAFTAPWLVVSGVLFILLFFLTPGLFYAIFVWIAFFGWIVFQAFFASRTSLRYAESVQIETRSRLIKYVFGALNVFCYVIVIGAFILLSIMNPPIILTAPWWWALLGTLAVSAFNFLNGLIMIRRRNTAISDNLALLGLFIAFYASYFLYNILKPVSATIDLFSLIIDLGISIFFILYTMSSVGLALSSRAHLETRLKLSSELAATLTYFLASGYLLVGATFETFALLFGGDPLMAARIPDVIKLFIFPLIALIMELLFIRRAGKVPPPPEEEKVRPPIVEEILEELEEPLEPEAEEAEVPIPDETTIGFEEEEAGYEEADEETPSDEEVYDTEESEEEPLEESDDE